MNMGDFPLDTYDIKMAATLLFYITLLIGGGMLIWVWIEATVGEVRGLLLYAFTAAVLVPVVIFCGVFRLLHLGWDAASVWVLGSFCLSYAFVLVPALTAARGSTLRIASRVLLGFTTLPFVVLLGSVFEAFCQLGDERRAELRLRRRFSLPTNGSPFTRYVIAHKNVCDVDLVRESPLQTGRTRRPPSVRKLAETGDCERRAIIHRAPTKFQP